MNFFGRRKKKESSEKGFKVYTTRWTTICAVNDFAVGKPELLVLNESKESRARQGPVYVLRLPKGFRVFDMEQGGEYECRVWRGKVMIRRRLPRASGRGFPEYRVYGG